MLAEALKKSEHVPLDGLPRGVGIAGGQRFEQLGNGRFPLEFAPDLAADGIEAVVISRLDAQQNKLRVDLLAEQSGALDEPVGPPNITACWRGRGGIFRGRCVGHGDRSLGCCRQSAEKFKDRRRGVERTFQPGPYLVSRFRDFPAALAMNVFGKFRRRPAAERWLFLEALGQLVIAKVELIALPFRRIAAGLGSPNLETPAVPLAEEPRQLGRQVGWAVQAVARHVPLGFVCLPQAIAAKRMLRRRGIETTLYLGARPAAAGGLTAHAWLRSGPAILTGRAESRAHRAVVAFGAAADFPPQLASLLGLLRASLHPENTAPVAIREPAALARCIARHRVGGFLHARLPAPVLAALPELLREDLAAQARANTLRAMAQASELLRLSARFEAAGIPFLSIKGPLLSQALYGDLRTRHAGDLDLLIARDDLPRAKALLEADVYHQTRPPISLTPRQMEHYAEKEFEFQGGPHRLRVELRWRLDGIGDLASLAPTATKADLHGTAISTPDPTLNAVYLCQHGAIHGWRRLFWLVDVALLFGRKEIDWAEARRKAEARGIDRALREAAALAEELLAIPRPAALEWRGERRVFARLLRNARAQIALPPGETAGLKNFLRELRHRALLHRSLAGKWRSLSPHLRSVRNWEDLPLPDRWFWLYRPLTPWLWMRRRWRGARRGQSRGAT